MFYTYILPILIFIGMGLLAGILLTVASKLLEVKTDERMAALADALPDLNCGACGFSGCAEYAKAVLNGAPTNLCLAGGGAVAAELSTIMGVAAGQVKTVVAFVKCSGSRDNTERKFDFKGTASCLAASRFYKGSEVCTHACLGFGDCVAICPNAAISIVDGLARVDKSLCVGCGMCVRDCPKGLIIVKEINNLVDVVCSSTDAGKVTKAICKKGCIGCKICEKKCPERAITVRDDLAHIDYDKCAACGQCVALCPTGAIQSCYKKA